MFIPKTEVEKRVDYTSTDEKTLDLPLAVLVNGYSASASEIFAGAIQGSKSRNHHWNYHIWKRCGSVHSDSEGWKCFPKSQQTATLHRAELVFRESEITPDEELEYEFTGPEGAGYSVEYDNQIQKALEVLQQ